MQLYQRQPCVGNTTGSGFVSVSQMRWHYLYRPKRSFGQGYVFTGVCDSVHRGGCSRFCSNFGGCSRFCFNYFVRWGGWVCLFQIFGGEGWGGGSAPNFGGDVCSKFSGGMSAPNFRGGVCSKFWGVSAPNFRGGVACGLLVWWPSGLVAFWSGGLLVWWPSGLVAFWSGGLLVWWPSG